MVLSDTHALPLFLSQLQLMTQLTSLTLQKLEYNGGSISDEFCGLSMITSLRSLKVGWVFISFVLRKVLRIRGCWTVFEFVDGFVGHLSKRSV